MLFGHPASRGDPAHSAVSLCLYSDLKKIFLKNRTTSLYTMNSIILFTDEKDIPCCSSWMCLGASGNDDRLITFLSKVVDGMVAIGFIDSGSLCVSPHSLFFEPFFLAAACFSKSVYFPERGCGLHHPPPPPSLNKSPFYEQCFHPDHQMIFPI